MEIVEYKNNLIEAFNEKRIREYNPEMRNKASYTLIDELLNLLGVNAKEGNSEHHVEAFKFINETMDRFSYSDIRLAFKKYVAGEYDLLVTQQLNAVVIGRVMKIYEEKRNTEVLKREQKQDIILTDDQKEEIIKQGLIGTWNEFLEKGDLSSGYTWVYDRFDSQGVIVLSKDEKVSLMKQAESNLISRKLEERGTMDISSFKRALEDKGDPIKNEAKRIALVNFLRSITQDEYKEIIS